MIDWVNYNIYLFALNFVILILTVIFGIPFKFYAAWILFLFICFTLAISKENHKSASYSYDVKLFKHMEKDLKDEKALIKEFEEYKQIRRGKILHPLYSAFIKFFDKHNYKLFDNLTIKDLIILNVKNTNINFIYLYPPTLYFSHEYKNSFDNINIELTEGIYHVIIDISGVLIDDIDVDMPFKSEEIIINTVKKSVKGMFDQDYKNHKGGAIQIKKTSDDKCNLYWHLMLDELEQEINLKIEICNSIFTNIENVKISFIQIMPSVFTEPFSVNQLLSEYLSVNRNRNRTICEDAWEGLLRFYSNKIELLHRRKTNSMIQRKTKNDTYILL